MVDEMKAATKMARMVGQIAERSYLYGLVSLHLDIQPLRWEYACVVWLRFDNSSVRIHNFSE